MVLESESGKNRRPSTKSLAAYLAATLHEPITLHPWVRADTLPLFLSRRYRFFEGALTNRRCLFMIASERHRAIPKEISSHLNAVSANFEGIVVFVAPKMDSTLRARLIAQGIPFAVPGNQLYIPQLAMDLREHFRGSERALNDRLSPVAQAVFFHHVLNPRPVLETPSGLAAALPYTPMSLGRAFEELARHNLATVERQGRQKTISYSADSRLLVDVSKTLLQPPARGVHAVRFGRPKPEMLLAGESALAELTNLAPPHLPTYAIAASGWREFFRRFQISDLREAYEGEAIIETWRYDPKILSTGRTVDVLSLFAQFWDSPDERVAQAARQLLERLEW